MKESDLHNINVGDIVLIKYFETIQEAEIEEITENYEFLKIGGCWKDKESFLEKAGMKIGRAVYKKGLLYWLIGKKKRIVLYEGQLK